jgi:hypothetical protein
MKSSLNLFHRFSVLITGVLLFCSVNVLAQYNFDKSKMEVIKTSDQIIKNGLNKDPNFQVDSISVNQLNLFTFEPPILFSSEAMLTFTYTSTIPYYLTIRAERPEKGFTFVAQNLYASMFTSNMIAIRFSLQPLGITPGTQWPPSETMKIYLHFSQQPLPDPCPDFYQYELEVNPLDDNACMGYTISPGEKPPVARSNLSPPIVSMADSIVSKIDWGPGFPNIDLDSSLHPATANYAGDDGACAPAAASNSLMWLSKKFGIPLPTNSHRNLLDSLSKYMYRTPNDGATIDTFILGKLNFIEKYNLGVEMKFQSTSLSDDIPSNTCKTYAKNQNTGTYPTWDFLKKEVADSEDVELFYKWPKSIKEDSVVWFYHAVAASGYFEYANGKKEIIIKHDLDQSKTDASGTVSERCEITQGENEPIVLKRPPPYGERYVVGIVSESPGTPYMPLKAYIISKLEGFWNSFIHILDTITVELHTSSPPYYCVDSAKVILNTNGLGMGIFYNAQKSSQYYLVVKHRNSIETWSATEVSFNDGLLFYDFTTAASQAYGNNLKQIGSIWCIYSGDVNQDQFIDGSDVSECFNDASIGLSGYVVTDVTGDDFVDGADVSIVYNNASLGIGASYPSKKNHPTIKIERTHSKK